MRTATAAPQPNRGSGPPTPKQLRALRVLADVTGTTFTPPTTLREASVQIAAMQRRRREPLADRQRDREQVSRTLHGSPTDVGRIRGCGLRVYDLHSDRQGG